MTVIGPPFTAAAAATSTSTVIDWLMPVPVTDTEPMYAPAAVNDCVLNEIASDAGLPCATVSEVVDGRIHAWFALMVSATGLVEAVAICTPCANGAAVLIVQFVFTDDGVIVTAVDPLPLLVGGAGVSQVVRAGSATEKRAYPAENGEIEQAFPPGP